MYSFGVRSIGGREPGSRGAGEPGEPEGAAAPSPSVLPSFRPSVLASLRLCVFTYSQSPSFPPSLPYPDSRYPPNPLAASNRLVQLTHTVPALSRGAMSSEVLRFSLQTLAASP